MTPANDGSLEARDGADATDSPDEVQVWMVERTFSQDCPHIMVIKYATEDGSRYFQKERAVPSFNRASVPEVTAAMDVSPDRLSPVEDEATRERYATEAERMEERHDPDDVV